MHSDEIFSDIFAHKKNLITGVDARIKLAFALLALFANLFSVNLFAPLLIAALCLLVLIMMKIPFGILVSRLALPLLMALVVLLTQLFLNGVTPLFTIDLGIVRLTGYEEGLAHGLQIMACVAGGVFVTLLLTMSTPANALFLAARWFRAPKVFIELSLLIYRYIFVLAEEIEVIRSAQKVRLGYLGWRRSMDASVVLSGSLVLRAYDRAERVFEAMLIRGYTGSMDKYNKYVLKDSDYLAVALLCLLFAALLFIGRLS